MTTRALSRPIVDPRPVVRRVEHVMGMPISLALRGRHAGDRRGEDAWQEALAALRDVDRVFSTYRSDSWVCRYGRGEVDLDDCPPELAEVLARGAVAEAETGGAFSVWQPAPGGGVAFDPSGVVKGWAVDRAAKALWWLPETDVNLSAGGDLRCRTLDPDSPAWRVGVEDPLAPDRLIAVLEVSNGAVATSGAAHRGDHVRDARTGAVPQAVASVTVVAQTLTMADVDATAAYALGPEAAHWLRDRPGRTSLVCWQDGTTTSYATPPDSFGG